MRKFEKYSKWIITLIFAIIGIAVYKTFDNFHKILSFFGLVWKSLSPFIIGFVIAYVVNIPCKKICGLYSKSKYAAISKRAKGLSILTVYLVAFLMLFILIRSIVPAIYKNVIELYYNVPKYFDDVMSFIVKWQTDNNITMFEVDKLSATHSFNNLISKIDITQFSKYAQGVIGVTSGVVNFFIGLIVSVYMLLDKDRIIASAKRIIRIFFKKEKSNGIIGVVSKINIIFSKYIFCLILDALFMAIASTLVLSILRVKYSLILGMLIGVCNFIPYFGAIVAVAVTILITLLTGGVFKAIWALVVLLLLQQVDGNFVGPKIMGEMLDVSPLWIIFAVTLGGGLFGVGGMVVSVPMFIALKMLVSEYIDEKEKKQSEEQTASEEE